MACSKSCNALKFVILNQPPVVCVVVRLANDSLRHGRLRMSILKKLFGKNNERTDTLPEMPWDERPSVVVNHRTEDAFQSEVDAVITTIQLLPGFEIDHRNDPPPLIARIEVGRPIRGPFEDDRLFRSTHNELHKFLEQLTEFFR